MMVSRPNTIIVLNLLSLLVSIVFVAACSAVDEKRSALPALEKQQQSAGPALWLIADDDTALYLFGVAELIPPDTQWESPIISRAFKQADLIILEADERLEAQANLGAIVQELGVFRDGRTLLDVLSADQQEEIGAVSTSLGAPLEALAPLKPWLAAVQLGALNAVKQGYQNFPSGLRVLATKAETLAKPIQFFEESRADLLRVIAALPEETHVNMLVSAARQIRTNPTQGIDVVPVWLAGDVEELADQYHGEGQWADEIIYEALLIKRNQVWVKNIKALLKQEKGTIFIGVGAGHLLGPDSLICMLEKNGFTVTRQ